MKQYHEMLTDTTKRGYWKDDRTGTGTISAHSYNFRHDMSEGFPLLTTKKMPFKTILTEWKWMMLGITDARWLQDNKCTIWDEWATISQCNKFKRVVGDLGPVYGHQWRNFGATPNSMYSTLWGKWRRMLIEVPQELSFDDIDNVYELRDSVVDRVANSRMDSYPKVTHDKLVAGLKDSKYLYTYNDDGVDQILNLVELLRDDPNSRRMIVTGWNPMEATKVALPPCHTMWQMQTTGAKLNLTLHQRSGDEFLGIPFNIAFYGFMIHFFAEMFQMEAGELVTNTVDSHIYNNHIDVVNTQLGREPYALPKLVFSDEYKAKLRTFASTTDYLITDSIVMKQSFNELISSMEIGKDVMLVDYKHHDRLRADVAI